MSVKNKVLAAAATVTMVAGLGAAGTLSANAATPECGDSCIKIYSAKFGTAEQPNLVETVYKGVARVGQPTAMYPVSTSDPAGDIVGHRLSPVSDFYKDGLVSAEVNEHYGDQSAVEVEYAPHGVRTGLCAGLAHTAYQGEGLTLQKCGVSANTVWIIDIPDASQGHFPLVSGSTTDFAHPYAMTVTHDASGYDDVATAVPMQLRVARLMGTPSDVPDSQLWGATK
ncbi:hypothetical protein GCM10011579_026120 [Streptomyces albiflavescens]|uniref:Uncharacterized protein n=1 Tax=Streptomyces albiflavescens TaxID=1623582 RepID=A0A917XZ69_9ACTN|nr:hypothetical protein [Streptomyces albiflavescens]GGN60729.1 hypothetical protein GCM10011579_026120 [Streptomyces albiflavescens]